MRPLPEIKTIRMIQVKRLAVNVASALNHLTICTQMQSPLALLEARKICVCVGMATQ
jgi:hypothetical protein